MKRALFLSYLHFLGKYMKQLKLIIAALLVFSPFAANAGVISMTETFDEFGVRTTEQDGFVWTFTGLTEAVGNLTIKFDWERMDFDSSFEWMDTFAEGNLLGRLGLGSSQTCVTAADNLGIGFRADCSGSITFITAAAGLLSDGILSLTSMQQGVQSSGGPIGSSFGFISATLSYVTAPTPEPGTPEPGTPVPEPGTLALLGLGLAGMGMTRRKKKV
jgi:hypothetical protein